MKSNCPKNAVNARWRNVLGRLEVTNLRQSLDSRHMGEVHNQEIRGKFTHDGSIQRSDKDLGMLADLKDK